VHITTKVVSSNPAHGELYSIQHYVIKFVSDLRQDIGFLRVFRFSSTNKNDLHDIAEILLKVALNIITLTLAPIRYKDWERIFGCAIVIENIKDEYFVFLQHSRCISGLNSGSDTCH